MPSSSSSSLASSRRRVDIVASHVAGTFNANSFCSASSQKNLPKGPDDVVIVSALRTAIGKARKGSFAKTTPDDLLVPVLEAVMKQSGAKYEDVGDVCVGNCQQGGSYAGPARMAQFRAGFPETVPLSSVNRQCSSGLQAVANIAAGIRAGFIDGGIGAGVESMTSGGGVADPNGAPPPLNLDEIVANKLARDSLTPMGVTSENVATRYGITRLEQDTMALQSNQKAIKATEMGWFKDEIVPVTVKDKDGNTKVVTKDDGPRASTIEKLGTLKAVFKEGGSTTAGNASQVSDGAAAVLLMRRSKAESLGLPIIGTMHGYRVVGVQPDEMGVGPAVAIPAVLDSCGLPIQDVDVFEINEAFASQAMYCVKKLGIDMEKVNPNGGAIALGHPLGMTGARQIATLMNQLRRTKKRYGVVSMCIGTGMGAAGLFEAE